MESQQSNLETPTKLTPDHHEITDLNSESPPRPLPEPFRDHDSPPRASINEPMKKIGTPDRLRVPVAFKHPERYRSPTDAMMSPVTKGLLARTRKASGSLIPPSFNQTKIQELRKPESGLSSLSQSPRQPPQPQTPSSTPNEAQPQSQPQRKASKQFNSQTLSLKFSRTRWFSCFHCPSNCGLFK